MNIMNSLQNLVKLIKIFNENYGNRNTHGLSVMNQITIYRNKYVQVYDELNILYESRDVNIQEVYQIHL